MAVDDDAAVLKLLKAQLEFMGCEVIDVVDSREALLRLTQEKVDGLFVDVLMPHVDGFRLTREARLSKLNHRVPIVMLTGMDNAKTMRKGFEAGANFFLGKPFARERIHNLLGATRGAMLRERQRYARLAFSTKVDCTSGTDNQKRFRSESVNISEGGMLLVPSGGLAVGQELEVDFRLPAPFDTIKARAKVVREAPSSAIGIQFLKLNAEQERDLRAYIGSRIE
jgi:two-component system, chemotaxis family, chemotaxis protein CheY